jgi:uncharacterized protein YjbJ (UPF0337 family)
MDRDRVAGSAKKIKGSIKEVVGKEVVGKAAGDAKLEAEGKADKVEDKVQNAVGGLKTPVRKQDLPNRAAREGAATVVMSPRRL